MKKLNAFAMPGAIAALFITLVNTTALAQKTAPARGDSAHPPAIASISVCSPNVFAAGPGSCPSGSIDTHQIVLAPDGKSVNNFGGVGGISDEHSSVFSPGTLGGNHDYLFFFATRTSLNSDTGVAVLTGGSGPNLTGQWTMDFPQMDRYGSYPSGFGQIFLSPVGRGCPTVLDGNPAHQDQTFDLNYAAAGSVVTDPTSGPGNLLMIYEGTNTCFGTTGGPRSTNFYSTVGVATSADYGLTWPTYRRSATFSFFPLPSQNTSQGPGAPAGSLGGSVCIGNDCATPPASSYGRYAILSPPVSVATAMATGKPLPGSLGDAEPSAFVDDAASGPAQYLYEVHGYAPGDLGGPQLPDGRKNDLTIARAQLNGGTAPLSFMKWNGKSFGEPGVGGVETPILSDGSFQGCGDLNQKRSSGSINYVDETGQYLLTFICDSRGDPAGGQSGGKMGSAWFYSTSYDLSDPGLWSQPQEIIGSWSEWDTSGGCPVYKGWYPTFMSLGSKPGHLSTTGHVFYLWGCVGSNTPPPGRQYSSRAFTITSKPPNTLAIELAKQKASGKLIVFATGTDPKAVLSIRAFPLSPPIPNQPPIDLGTMSKTDTSGNEFFITKKGLPPISSVEITSTSGGSLTAQVKGH